MFMSRRLFPWPDITALCLGEGQEILVDGVSRGEVCSKSEQERLSHHHDDGFAWDRSFDTLYGDLFGLG